VVERDGGTLYCTAVLISPREGYLSKHRKLSPTAMERLIWGQGDGTTLPVLDAEFKRWGGYREDEDLGCDLLVSAFVKEV
jgi:predicted amidohydrolase